MLERISNMEKGKKKKLIVGVIVALFIVTLGPVAIRFGANEGLDKDIFDFGTPNYQINTLGVLTPLTTDSVVYADTSSIKLTFTWGYSTTAPTADDFHLILRTSVWDNIEDVYSSKSGNVYTFNFDLENTYTGTNTYYLTFYAATDFFYIGDSFSFQITKYTPQQVDAPTWIETPDDIADAPVGYTKDLTWKFKYTEKCTVTLEQDGIEIDSRVYEKTWASVYTQDYTYPFVSTEEGNYIFKLTVDPEGLLPLAISDDVNVGTITWEDYTLIDGAPDGMTNVSVIMDGTMSLIGWSTHNEWLIGNAAPIDVYDVPKQGNLNIKLMFQLAGVSMDTLGNTKVVIFNSANERTEYPMTSQFEVKYFFGFTYNSWKQVVINLDDFVAGEYRCEIRTVSDANNQIYKIATFNLSVNTLPVGWIVSNAGLIAIIGVVSIVTVKLLREGKGWWGFQGKYGNK